MDQIKIGRFIAERRKTIGLTQAELAERLGITDRAVSKWETGRSLPDASLMLELCEQLNITVNELLCGEEIAMENYNQQIEKTLLEMVKQKQEHDKSLLRLEVVIGIMDVAVMLALIVVAAYASLEEWMRILLIVVGMLPLLISLPFLLKIEQVAGYYECRLCGHRYVPTYQQVNRAPHMGRTRYMKCPHCEKKSWQKKVLTKE